MMQRGHDDQSDDQRTQHASQHYNTHHSYHTALKQTAAKRREVMQRLNLCMPIRAARRMSEGLNVLLESFFHH